ncbi:hypothetical protein LTR97_012686 [Elasticomyces elasticus]|uniref:BTB domain-containing protein n=1 Tax=Elasticomyces elasticus TaxID=574655 RepID=A0AAN7W1E4_9PEZI|nr:hypothetical protein LTR97_012686 [Elasticomyces elasticus]
MPDMQVKATKRKRAVPQDDTTEAGIQEEEGNDEHNIEEESRPAERFRSSFTDTITVLVGEEKVPFTIHTKTVRAKSKFFDAACQREWIEGRERVVKLPEVDPETFELYATWVYQGKIDHEALRIAALNPRHIATEEEQRTEGRVKYWSTSTMDLMRLHVAADFLGDTELMKRAVDGITDIIASRCTWIYTLTDIVSYVWDATTSASGLRRIVLDHIVSAGTRKTMHDFLLLMRPHVPSEFLADLAFHSLKASSKFDTSEFGPSPTRRHRYYDGYESDEEGEPTQQDT